MKSISPAPSWRPAEPRRRSTTLSARWGEEAGVSDDVFARLDLSKKQVPSSTKLIYLLVDDVSWFERVGERAEGRSDLPRADAHRVEANLRDSLPTIADATIDARNNLPFVVAECLSLIESWRIARTAGPT